MDLINPISNAIDDIIKGEVANIIARRMSKSIETTINMLTI